ncbi:MAG: peptidoglycan-associated lipoprotein Pal [Gallionellaceae bacterium]|nr:peptidoglycan-associated lipoprotein Pal [Gallionellaceae bacterium]
MKKLIIGVLLVNFLVACASDKPKEAAETASAPVAAAPTSTPAVATPAPAEVTTDPLNDTTSLLAKRSVYFAYDASAVQDSDKPVVMAHAKYLSEHAERKVRLIGHADERGSNEYNLALGQRRADSVKKMLILGGAKDSQIETVSYGEEKPKATGHDEAAWAQNRRADFLYFLK